MPTNELEMFLAAWDREAASTVKLLQALPATQYDFRPDATGRSLGELAWHLAEGDAYISYGIDQRQFNMSGAKPPNIERPRAVGELASRYEQVHREAVARIRKLTPQDLDQTIQFFNGPMKDGSKGISLFYAIRPDGSRLYHDIARPKDDVKK